MNAMTLMKAGGASAVLYVVGAIGLLGFLFVEPDLLEAVEASEFLPIMVESPTTVGVAAWLLIVLPILLGVAGMSFFVAARSAGSWTLLPALAFVGGSWLIITRGAIWWALTYELAPAYANADPATQEVLMAVANTLEGIAFITADIVGGTLIAGVGAGLYSVAAYQTRLVGRRMLWLGAFVAVFGGLFTLLGPLAPLLFDLSIVGFIAFWFWMVIMGVKVWRLKPAVRRSGPRVTPRGAPRVAAGASMRPRPQS